MYDTGNDTTYWHMTRNADDRPGKRRCRIQVGVTDGKTNSTELVDQYCKENEDIPIPKSPEGRRADNALVPHRMR
jgi:hypothetical protein